MSASAPVHASDAAPRLFGQLPPDLFRLLSGPARWFFADLLEHLGGDLFSTVAAVVSQRDQRDAVAAIAELIDRKGRTVALEQDAGETTATSTSPEQRARIAYRRLVVTGWLIEHRDRYRRLVDLDGNARLLLQLPIDIRRGRTRAYGGEVLQATTPRPLAIPVRMKPPRSAIGLSRAKRGTGYDARPCASSK